MNPWIKVCTIKYGEKSFRFWAKTLVSYQYGTLNWIILYRLAGIAMEEFEGFGETTYLHRFRKA